MHPKKTTIHDVARKAGVSAATVSRVLNTPAIVREETRNRVLAVVQELSYVPNPLAKAFTHDRSRLVALIIPSVLNANFADIIRGAGYELSTEGYGLIIGNSEEELGREVGICRLLRDKSVDGVIFAFGTGDAPPVSELNPRAVTAFIDREADSPYVDTFFVDDTAGMRRICGHLAELGHERIGFLGGAPATVTARRRRAAFLDALTGLGLPTIPGLHLDGEWTMAWGREGCKRLLSRPEPPTAIIACGDHLAIGALRGAADIGRRVPEDVSIAGYDNSPLGRYTTPTLTTLSFPNYELGRRAARAIMRRLYQPSAAPLRWTFPLELVPGESCGWLRNVVSQAAPGARG